MPIQENRKETLGVLISIDFELNKHVCVHRLMIDYMMDAQESYTDMDITESDLNIVEQELLKDGMLTKDVVEDLKEDVTKGIPKKGLMSREPIEEEIQ